MVGSSLLDDLVKGLLVLLCLLLLLNLLLQLFNLDEVVADHALYLLGVLSRPHSSRHVGSAHAQLHRVVISLLVTGTGLVRSRGL